VIARLTPNYLESSKQENMTLIINSGSENTGGTFEQAELNAKKFLEGCHDEGLFEVEMSFVEVRETGNFVFHFTHKVTGKVVELSTHGFTDDECRQFMFNPRVYWNGSSTADPKIEDFMADGFTFRVEFYRV
jgi:hypothetical protein